MSAVPTLYIVATPIGNLEDLTLRALRVLGQVGLVAAEDTRTTRKLLNHYNIKARLTSYNDHNSATKVPQILDTLEQVDVALVSEAGMPGISDPGQRLVEEVGKSGFPVVPVPGPSAVTTALAVSGLPSKGYIFLGFLPRRKGDRARLLESVADQPFTLVAFEAPHRLRASLEDVLAVLGDRPVAVCRELTKLHEEVFRGSLSQALDHFQEPRGEFTLVVAGAQAARRVADRELLREELGRMKRRGLGAREAVATVAADSGLPRRELYRLWLGVEDGAAEEQSP